MNKDSNNLNFMSDIKVCAMCKQSKTKDQFPKNKSKKNGISCYCKECNKLIQKKYSQKPEVKERTRERRREYYKYPINQERRRIKKREMKHKLGLCRPQETTKDCSNWLGIVKTEELIFKVFNDIIKMPVNNPGFDFICKRGFTLDSKSAILAEQKNKNPRWYFTIRYNKVPDYFICVGYISRDDLSNPKVWLIPGKLINDKKGLSITNTEKSLKRWKMYEIDGSLAKKIEKCSLLCNE